MSDFKKITYLTDASDAGGNESNCTLILTEGDSAKALAVAGLVIICLNLFLKTPFIFSKRSL